MITNILQNMKHSMHRILIQYLVLRILDGEVQDIPRSSTNRTTYY